MRLKTIYKYIFFLFLEILSKWPLFGSSFFAVKRVPEGKEKGADHILALNRHGVHFIDLLTHVSYFRETLSLPNSVFLSFFSTCNYFRKHCTIIPTPR